MQKRFVLLLTVVLLAAAIITGLASYSEISRYNDETNRSYLLAAARLIEQDLADGKTPAQASANAIDVYTSDTIMIRVTIVDEQGTVLYDNEANAAGMENHLLRPEISNALETRGMGSAIRFSKTLQVKMLYLALYDPAFDLVIRTAMSLRYYQAGLNRILLTIGLVTLVTLVVLFVITYLVARKITEPLNDLKRAALAMSSGQYQTRVRNLLNEDNEISALSEAFNTMAERLQNVVGDLKAKNTSLDIVFNSMTDPLLAVTKDAEVTLMNRQAREVFGRTLDTSALPFPLVLLTHSRETEELVARACASNEPAALDVVLHTTRGDTEYRVMASSIISDHAADVILTFHDVSETKKLQKMRSDFVANVTHELRTPLTSIRGFIETLRGGAINQPDKADRFLQIIDIEAERLHKLISDILILSEIEDLRSDPERVKFDLRAMIDEVAVMLDDTATSAKVSVVVENPDQPLPVSANPNRIKQVLLNLAENAIKYNLPGGKVFLDAERQADGKVLLSVRDTGVGIAPEHQERVFERFYRVDTSRSRELGGTGLGLSIVKHIAQLYSGTASVTSRPGEGSTFQVVLDI